MGVWGFNGAGVSSLLNKLVYGNKNSLKLIRLLFLDDLHAEFDAIVGNKSHAKSAKVAKENQDMALRTSRTLREIDSLQLPLLGLMFRVRLFAINPVARLCIKMYSGYAIG